MLHMAFNLADVSVTPSFPFTSTLRGNSFKSIPKECMDAKKGMKES